MGRMITNKSSFTKTCLRPKHNLGACYRRLGDNYIALLVEHMIEDQIEKIPSDNSTEITVTKVWVTGGTILSEKANTLPAYHDYFYIQSEYEGYCYVMEMFSDEHTATCSCAHHLKHHTCEHEDILLSSCH